MNDILHFNQVIDQLGLMEIPPKGRRYTWSNMQEDPLLVQLDWCFASVNWALDYHNNLMLPMAKSTSNRVQTVQHPNSYQDTLSKSLPI